MQALRLLSSPQWPGLGTASAAPGLQDSTCLGHPPPWRPAWFDQGAAG